MIKKLCLFPECQFYPIWLYDENDVCVDNALPDDLWDDDELIHIYNSLMKRFNAAYCDNKYALKYMRFQAPDSREKFIRDWKTATELLRKKVKGRYEIVDELEVIFNDDPSDDESDD